MILIASLFTLLLGDHFDGPLTFKSFESKTITQGDVFNSIRYIPGKKKDVWMMNQSHKGVHAKDWDRLAIVVDKEEKTAEFFQLRPGNLEWKETLREKQEPFLVSCFMCHSNGPRAIRVDPQFPQTAGDKMKTWVWNMRIKSYGRLKPHANHSLNDPSLARPFRLSQPVMNEKLEVASCVKCHKEDGFLARGTLTRQNFITIQFMLDNKLMPPIGEISKEENQKIKEFLDGF